VSDPEDQDLPFQRSSIGAIGARKRWRLFGGGKDEDDAALSAAAASGSDDGPPVHSMLGDLAAKAVAPSSAESDADDRPPIHNMLGDLAAENGSSFLAEEEDVDEGPPVHSMLGDLAARSGPLPELEPGGRSMLSLGGPSAGPSSGGDLIGPLTQHSTIAEIGGLEEHTASTFPIERGVLISLVAHVALILLLLFLPARIPSGSKGDLFAMMEPEPRDNTPIPVILDAPGPARPNPKRAPLSDADRRAGGGDKSRPKSDTPYVPPSSGVAGLAPGPRAPRVAGSQSPSRPAAPAQATQQAADRSKAGEKSDLKPSEFPTEARPQGEGPREIGKLANLNSAIQAAAQETARGAMSGGEGGAPAGNPDGGFVDSGPLSFDTKWYDWGAYAAEMIRRIKLHWDVPELARLGWKGSLTVRFYIMADGRVADAKIVRYSGIPPFDNAALQAILKSSPFRPLPSDLHEEREGITITFFYNMRPESEEGRAQE
jgi:TonB family protein